MNSINEALQIILGGKSGGYYLAGFFFSFLAVLISLYQHSKTRNKYSDNTPYKFSWSFLFWDNFKRIFTSIVIMFILFRLFDLSNPAAMIGVGFFVAFGLDKAIQFVMEKTDIMQFLEPARKKEQI